MGKRVAAVTGGIGGLGTAFCIRLAQAGRKVIALDLDNDPHRLDEFRQDVDGHDVHFLPLDVSDHLDCARVIGHIQQAHGSLDILINNAGITRDASLRKMQHDQWQAVIDVNLGSVFNTCRAAVEGMTASGFGRIVNVSSVNGQTGQFGQTNYSAAKAGMHGFTMALAREVASKGVTVNTVSPGYCQTSIVEAVPQQILEGIIGKVPVGRLAQPAEIARAIEFLAADDAGFITGANLPVNGGLFMSF